jgi:hypothetical protein
MSEHVIVIYTCVCATLLVCAFYSVNNTISYRHCRHTIARNSDFEVSFSLEEIR